MSRASTTPHQASYNVAKLLIAAAFPATPTNYATGEQVTAFEYSVLDRRLDNCLRADGFPAAPTQPFSYLAERDNEQFPDLPEIAKVGLSVIGAPQPRPLTSVVPHSEAAAYKAAVTRCNRSASAPFKKLFSLVTGALDLDWHNTLAKVENSVPVQHALRSFVKCVQSGGIDVNSLNAFLSYGTARIARLAATKRQRAEAFNMRSSKLYARCMRPVVAAREPLRRAALRRFLATHALKVAQIRSSANTTIRHLERETGIKLPLQRKR